MSATTPRFGQIAGRLADNGYQPVPVHFGHKNPIPSEWQHYQFAESDLARFPNAGTGLLAGRVIGADNDVRDPAIAAQIEDLAETRLGQAPRRIGQAPKVLRMYQVTTPFSKISTRGYRLPGDDPEAKAHKVEILAAGQQFVVYNIHPDTGKPYEWNGAGDPLTVPIGMLPMVTEAQVRAFVAEAEAILAAHGQPVGRLAQADDDRQHEPNEAQRAADTALLREALAAIPNEDLEFDDWIRIAYAVKGALGDEGIADFLKWSAKSVKDTSEFTARQYLAAKPRRIGAGTIFHIARQVGWQRPHNGAATGGNTTDLKSAAAVAAESVPVSLSDFYAYMPGHTYLFVPAREMWPAASVNARIPIWDVPGYVKDGEDNLKPHQWLDSNQAVEQMTWAPGFPMLIVDKLVDAGGWIDRPGCNTFNLYRPPTAITGDPSRAAPWLDHFKEIYPDNVDHCVHWLAHRAQRPGEKINHALVLGGGQGIGKDTLLEPVKYAIGPWNWSEVSPAHLLGRFNPFVKSVVMRISEARDLGDVDRFSFYDHTKIYTAAPPDVLRCDEKNLREHAVMNVCGVIITSNHKQDGIYLPADDRRHYVAWSERIKEEFSETYWRNLYGWYASGGYGHVVAYLRTLDISGFNPKAPPPKTAAFHDIVDSNRSPEDAELADVLEAIGSPPAVTIDTLCIYASDSFREWLKDRRSARQIPHRLETGGYVAVRNDSTADGRWKIEGKNVAVYAKRDLSIRDRMVAATALARRARG